MDTQRNVAVELGERDIRREILKHRLVQPSFFARYFLPVNELPCNSMVPVRYLPTGTFTSTGAVPTVIGIIPSSIGSHLFLLFLFYAMFVCNDRVPYLGTYLLKVGRYLRVTLL